MYKPYHLIGLELGISVASAALRGEPLVWRDEVRPQRAQQQVPVVLLLVEVEGGNRRDHGHRGTDTAEPDR